MNENNLSTEKILEQSLELNKIQADLLKDKNKNQRLPIIMAIIAFASAVIIVVSLLFFFAQYEFYAETTTITQDTGEGTGNNVYQEGEQAQYHEASEVGDGKTKSDQS